MPTPSLRVESAYGCLLGIAIGDALGLPVEMLSRTQIARRGGKLAEYHLWPGRPVPSDDTELSCRQAMSLLATPEDAPRVLGWQLRRWLLTAPPGVGWATLRACLRLWFGWPATRAGVRSAGNGAAMRSAPIGLRHAGDEAAIRLAVEKSCAVTHRDTRAVGGALTIALGVSRLALNGPPAQPAEFACTLAAAVRPTSPEVADRLHAVSELLVQSAPEAFAATGVSGFVLESVPAAVLAYLRHPHSGRDAVLEMLAAGGDTDTNASMTGALAGAALGGETFPNEWRAPWRADLDYFQALAGALVIAHAGGAPGPIPHRPCWRLLGDRTRFLIALPAHLVCRLFDRCCGPKTTARSPEGTTAP